MAGIQALDTALESAEHWISDLMQCLGWHDRGRTYLALVAVLHALRDCLPADEVVYLGQQLPPLVRGLYYEGWHSSRRATPLKSRNAFLERIHDGVHRDPAIDPEQVARAAFMLLAQRLPPAELEDAKALTARPLRALWPN
jgi:uncharacterized protein (DUF2267 family)